MNDDVTKFFLHWSNEITALITGSIFNTLKMAVANTLPMPEVKIIYLLEFKGTVWNYTFWIRLQYEVFLKHEWNHCIFNLIAALIIFDNFLATCSNIPEISRMRASATMAYMSTATYLNCLKKRTKQRYPIIGMYNVTVFLSQNVYLRLYFVIKHLTINRSLPSPYCWRRTWCHQGC